MKWNFKIETFVNSVFLEKRLVFGVGFFPSFHKMESKKDLLRKVKRKRTQLLQKG